MQKQKRVIETIVCAQCGSHFAASYKATYCSRSCSAKARVAKIGTPVGYVKSTIKDLMNFRKNHAG